VLVKTTTPEDHINDYYEWLLRALMSWDSEDFGALYLVSPSRPRFCYLEPPIRDLMQWGWVRRVFVQSMLA
jgi:hypothetical protein